MHRNNSQKLWGMKAFIAFFLDFTVVLLKSSDVLSTSESYNNCTGSPFFFNDTEGWIQNPDFPNPYSKNQLCEWHLTASSGFVLELEVKTYGMDATCAECDFVIIEDWAGNATSQLSRFYEPSQQSIIRTASDHAHVFWRTDSLDDHQAGESEYGFTVHWRAVNGEKDSSTWLTILLATLLPAICIVLSVCITGAICFWRKRTKLPKSLDEEYSLGCYISPAANFRMLLSELGEDELYKATVRLEVNGNSLEIGSIIGHGHFGFVHKAILRQNEDRVEEVAVKIVKSSQVEAIVDLVKEADLMSSLDHPNIIKLMGISIIDETPHLIFPYMENGSLKDYLRNLSDAELLLSCRQLLELCRQICDGMLYMTERSYIHRDLAARNILVDSKNQVKISDFGLGRQIEDGGYYKCRSETTAIPIRWLPPESFLLGLFDVHTDVWSFGVVCWEIFTCLFVFLEKSKNESYLNFIDYFHREKITDCETEPYHGLEADEIGMFIHNDNRLEKPDNCAENIYVFMMLNCWNKDRFLRPSFAKLLGEITHLLQETTVE